MQIKTLIDIHSKIFFNTFAANVNTISNTMIRNVIKSDAKSITQIYNHYILHSTISFETKTLTCEEMGKRIADISSSYPYYVYEEDGKIAGYCYAHPWKERAAYQNTLETTIYISPAHTHKGIGELLMRALIDECRNRGFHALIACITADNDPSCRFHAKLGFKQVSLFKEVGMKFGKWLDVADYELLL